MSLHDSDLINNENHKTQDCQRHDFKQKVFDVINIIDKHKLLSKESCCYKCFLSMSLCKEVKRESQSSCKYYFLIISCIVTAQQLTSLYDLSLIIDVETLHNQIAFCRFLCQKERLFDTDNIKAMSVFLYLVKKRQELKQNTA